MDYSLPGSSVHGILRQEYWSGLPCSPSGDLPDPGLESVSLVSCALAGGFFTTAPPGEPLFEAYFFTLPLGIVSVELWTAGPRRDPMKPHRLYHQTTVGSKFGFYHILAGQLCTKL